MLYQFAKQLYRGIYSTFLRILQVVIKIICKTLMCNNILYDYLRNLYHHTSYKPHMRIKSNIEYHRIRLFHWLINKLNFFFD